jgi:hypothetical protein
MSHNMTVTVTEAWATNGAHLRLCPSHHGLQLGALGLRIQHSEQFSEADQPVLVAVHSLQDRPSILCSTRPLEIVAAVQEAKYAYVTRWKAAASAHQERLLNHAFDNWLRSSHTPKGIDQLVARHRPAVVLLQWYRVLAAHCRSYGFRKWQRTSIKRMQLRLLGCCWEQLAEAACLPVVGGKLVLDVLRRPNLSRFKCTLSVSSNTSFSLRISTLLYRAVCVARF